MSEGYVYVLSNPSMPGLVKIGKTTRDPEERAAQLFVTGVPTPFKVEFATHTPDCDELESLMHDNFSQWRVSGSREFFRYDLAQIRSSLEGELEGQIGAFVSRYLPDHRVSHADTSLSEDDIIEICHRASEHPVIVGTALKDITSEEIAPILERYESACKARRELQEEENRRRKVANTPEADQ